MLGGSSAYPNQGTRVAHSSLKGVRLSLARGFG